MLETVSHLYWHSFSISCYNLLLKDMPSRAQWFMPVIPALWEAKTGRSPEVRSSRLAWQKWHKCVSTENIKISQIWWYAPTVPATREVEAGESLEPVRWR